MQYLARGIYQAHLRPDEGTLPGELMQYIQTGNMKTFSYVVDSISIMPFKVIILSRSIPVIPRYSENNKNFGLNMGLSLILS